jgi:hypothetical protein
MTSLTIEGILRDGKVELPAVPPGFPDGTPVRVQFPTGMTSESEREALRQEAFADMEAGLDLGGPPYPTRDEIHDRHDR